MKLAPARLAPVFVPRIWGARSLAPLFVIPAASPSDNAQEIGKMPAGERHGEERIGEVWLTGDQCVFAAGPFAGQTLGEAWPSLPVAWTGRRICETPRIPLLVKFIFPEDHLSVQVHPNDEYAREHEAASGGVGKTEMWYAVSAREHAELRLGFEAGVTPQTFRQALAEGTVDRCLRPVAVHSGDAFFIPAGTAHTIGPGMILCEVQQHSDLTYRVYDYNRVATNGTPRKLHVRQAFDVMNFGARAAKSAQPLESVQIQCGPLLKTYLAACPHFAVERWQFREPLTAHTSPDRFEVLVIVAGFGHIAWGQESAEYTAGQCWFVPAELGTFQLTPAEPSTLLRAYVPDLQELDRELTAEQIDPAARARVVYP